MFWGRYSIISYQWRNESWGSARNFEFTLQTQLPSKQKWSALKSQVLVCLLLQLSSLIIHACFVQYGHHGDSWMLAVWCVPAKRCCAKHTPDSDWVWTKRIWNNQIPREWFSYWLLSWQHFGYMGSGTLLQSISPGSFYLWVWLLENLRWPMWLELISTGQGWL